MTAGLVVVLGLLTIFAAAVGRPAHGGIDVALYVGLLSLVVGLCILLIDSFVRMRRREAGANSRPGIGLFITGLSLALGGMLYLWTGTLWFAILALGPPVIFRRWKG